MLLSPEGGGWRIGERGLGLGTGRGDRGCERAGRLIRSNEGARRAPTPHSSYTLRPLTHKSESQDVRHGVVAGLVLERPEGGPDGAAGEEVRGPRPDGQFEALAGPAKISVCSPTTEPPRRAAKPISPGLRAPVWPSRARTERSLSAICRPAAAASPRSSAVPEGASTFMRWCISRISMSKSSPRVAATLRTRPASRFTPRDMLPDCTIRAWRAAGLELREIVVLETRRPDHVDDAGLGRERRERHGGRRRVKSSTPSALAKTGRGSSVIGPWRRRSPRGARHPGRARASPRARWRRRAGNLASRGSR